MKTAQTRLTRSGETVVSAYLHSRANAAGTPLSGTFELTPRCNFSCRMCYVHENIDQSLEMTAEDWIGLGKTARDAGMLFLLLTGGEPFLRKDFVKIYTELRKMGFMITINTNASLLTDEILDALRTHMPVRVNVTLYGGNGETYKSLCGNPAFDRVKTNILRMKEANIPIRINCSVTPYNAQDIVSIYDFIKEHGFQSQSATYMYPPVRINGNQYGEAPHRFSPEDAAKYTLLCREQVVPPEKMGTMAVTPDEEDCARDVGDPIYCRAGKTTFWVTWDGKMLPCGTFPSEYGYDIRTMGFDRVWKQIRQDVSQLRMPKECAGCSLKQQCVICAAACIAEGGDTSVKPEYICRMTHRYCELVAEKYPRKENTNEAEP